MACDACNRSRWAGRRQPQGQAASGVWAAGRVCALHSAWDTACWHSRAACFRRCCRHRCPPACLPCLLCLLCRSHATRELILKGVPYTPLWGDAALISNRRLRWGDALQGLHCRGPAGAATPPPAAPLAWNFRQHVRASARAPWPRLSACPVPSCVPCAPPDSPQRPVCRNLSGVQDEAAPAWWHARWQHTRWQSWQRRRQPQGGGGGGGGRCVPRQPVAGSGTWACHCLQLLNGWPSMPAGPGSGAASRQSAQHRRRQQQQQQEHGSGGGEAGEGGGRYVRLRFAVGRFCCARLALYHALFHWRRRLLARLKAELKSELRRRRVGGGPCLPACLRRHALYGC